MWKLQTVHITHFYIEDSFPKKRKGATSEQVDLLYNDRHILKKVKARRENVALMWID